MLSTIAKMCIPAAKKEERPPKVNKNAPVAPALPTTLSAPLPSSIVPILRPGKNTGSGFVPPSQFLDEKLTQEVNDYRKNDRRAVLEEVQQTVKSELQERFEGIQVWCTGSLPGKVDLPSSDLDFTVKLPGMEDMTSFQKLMHIKETLKLDTNFRKNCTRLYVQGGRIPVLQLIHKRVCIDVTIDNDGAKRNTQILAWYAQMDERFPMLCKAVKAWAASVGLIGAAQGRLNSFTICLMVISYLQVGVCPAILPCLQKHLPNMEGDMEVETDDYDERDVKGEYEALMGGQAPPQNTSSLGSLFAGFLKYYSEFDFKKNWISVRRGEVIRKRRNGNQPLDGMPSCAYYIVVEDPFMLNPWNCGGSVQDGYTFERIKLEFYLSFKRMLRTRSIYGSFPSNLRKQLEAEGKLGDQRKTKWRYAVNVVFGDFSSWGTQTLTDEQVAEWNQNVQIPIEVEPCEVLPVELKAVHKPFQENWDPSMYWGSEKQTRSPLLEWPQIIRCI